MQEELPSSPKRKPPHPTAKAFFDALDQYQYQKHQHQQKVVDNDEDEDEEDDENKISNNDNDNDDDDDDGSELKKKKNNKKKNKKTTTKSTTTIMSKSLQRKCQSLGWRNRYSQNEYYPISLNINNNMSKNKTTGTIVNNNFSVRQVQRGEVDGTYGTGATVWPAALVLIKYLEYNANANTNATCTTNANATTNATATATANANANTSINDTQYDSTATATCTTGSQVQCGQNHHVNVNVDVINKHIIDLGSGTGVTSIAAAILGAKSIVCTDGIDSVVQLAKDNIQHVATIATVATVTTVATARATATTSTVATTANNNNAEEEEEEETSTPIVTTKTKTKTTTPIIINNCPIRTQKYWWGEKEGTAHNIIMSLLCNSNNMNNVDNADNDDTNNINDNDKANDNNNNNNNNNNTNNNNNDNNGLIILVADCVLPKLYPIEPLVQAIDECLLIYDDKKNTYKNNNNNTNISSCAILSYEYRYYTKEYDPKIEFIKLADAYGLDLYTVPKHDHHPIYSTDDIEIWIVTRKIRKQEKDKRKVK